MAAQHSEKVSIAVSMTCFLMAVSDGMSFVLDEVPPHPPRLGTGVVPCIDTKCVSPLGPAGFLSASPPRRSQRRNLAPAALMAKPVSHVPKAIPLLFRSRHKVAGYVCMYGAGWSVATEHLFLVICLLAAEADRILIITEGDFPAD